MGVVMSEWKEYRLEEIAQLEKDSWKVGDEELPYIALEHIVVGGLRLQGIGDSNTIASNKFRFNSDCFLFGKLRPYFRKLFRPNFEGICSTDIWVVKPRGENDKDFLFYFFANQEFVDFTYSGSSGTRMPRADWKFVGESKWNFPEPTEQTAIAEVLSGLDDKIDLLHRQNKTLEQMAETLFKQWFVEEAKEDWEWHQLGEFVEVMRGLSYKGAGLTEKGNGVPMHNLNSVFEGGGYKHKGIKYYSGEYKGRHLVQPGDVIITNTEQGHDMLLIGYPAIVPKYFGELGIFSQHIYKLKPKDEMITKSFLYYLLMTYDVREQIAGATNGSTVNMLAKDGIEWARFKLPPKKLIDAFSDFAQPLLEKKEKNYTQIKNLEKMRDTLLPKLMSGEIRVSIDG